ncbi:LLM class flavin-dependent oxidoreductase [Streptomyces lydicus]
MRLGVIILPEHPWPVASEIWKRAEDLGFHHAWTYDHLSWRSLRDAPWYDSMTTLTAAACVTHRMGLGVLVVSPDFRHPVTTAKEVISLDEISNGRFILGMGAGAGGPDSTVLGRPEPTRAVRTSRFEEFVELSDHLLCRPHTTWQGQHYEAVDARMVPGCVQRPRVPFAIAASGPRGLRLAARQAEFWVTIGQPAPGDHSEVSQLRALKEQAVAMEDSCWKAGRDPGQMRRLVHLSRIADAPYSSHERFADLLGRCAELGFTDAVVGYPRADGVFAGDLNRFENVVGDYARAHYGE